VRRHPLARCEECPLAVGGKLVPSLVPSSGKAKVAFVGEAPSQADTRTGTIFTGPSGKLLNIVMHHHGIERSDVVMTNACMCRPADGKAPPKSAIMACRPRLLAELQEAGVETAVALGNTAAEALTGQSKVTQLRIGPGKEYSYLDGVRVICTINPAAALRQGDQFPFIVQDIGKIDAEPTPWSAPDYVVADDEDTALAYLKQVLDRTPPDGVLVVDIESNIEKDVSFEVPSQHKLLCIGIGYAPNKVLVIGEKALESEKVHDALADTLNARKLVCQNGKFDLKGLYHTVGPLELWFDTMLASYVFDERSQIHGLKYQASEYLGAPQYEEEIKPYVTAGSGYGSIPRDILYKYNAYDVASTYSLWGMYERRFSNHPAGEELRKVHDYLVAASNQLMYVELNGIAIDRTYLQTLDREYVESLVDIRAQITKTTGMEINPNSPMQVKKYFLTKGIDMASTDAAHLQALVDMPAGKLPQDEDEVRAFLDLLLKHRSEAKMHGTYVKGIAKRMYAGRVFPTFLLHGTTSGRLSCRNPNLQNIPRDSKLRKQFVPTKEENRFIQLDYAQAELRVLSFLAQDSYFRGIFNDGTIDVFDDLTPRLFGEHLTKESVGPAKWKEMRIRVKAFVYGLNYGRGAGTIAEEFDMTLEEANRLKRNFFEVIPEIVAFQEETKRMVRAGEDLVTPWGRHRRYALITKENEHNVMNEALSFLPQSTASDMCLLALTWTRPQIKGLGFIRNIVHDSLLIEGHEKDMEEIGAIAEVNMLKAAYHIVGDFVKFKVDSSIGMNWGEV